MTVVDTRDALFILSKEIDDIFNLLNREILEDGQKQLLCQNLNDRVVRLLEVAYRGYQNTSYLPAPKWLTENAVKIQHWLQSEHLFDETKTVLKGSLEYQYHNPGKIPPFDKSAKVQFTDVGSAIIDTLWFLELLAFFADF